MSIATGALASEDTFDGTWSFRARYCNALGFRMHYVDEGSGPEILLFLHGDAPGDVARLVADFVSAN